MMEENELKGTTGFEGEKAPYLFVIEVGSDLVYLLKTRQNDRYPHQVAFIPSVHQIREDLMREWGLRLPAFLIRENRNIEPDSYRFLLFDREIVSRTVPPGKTLVITSRDQLMRYSENIEADPIFSRPCIWVESHNLNHFKEKRTYSASTGEVILDHIESVLRTHAHQFITGEMVQEKLDLIGRTEPEKVEITLQKHSFEGLVSIMKNLVPEGIPFTQLEGVIRTLAQSDSITPDPDTAAEKVRKALRNNINNFVFSHSLPMFVSLDHKIELYLYSRADTHHRVNPKDPVATKVLQELVNLYLYFQGKGFRLGVICSAPTRLVMRRILEKILPGVMVLKSEEMDSSRDVMIIKKIRDASPGFIARWFWAWLTLPASRRKRFSESIANLEAFLKKSREKPGSHIITPGKKPRKTVRIYNSSSSRGLNLPAPITITPRQKAAMYLTVNDDQFISAVFSLLSRREIFAMGTDMAGLPRDTAVLGRQLFEDVIRQPGSWSDPKNMATFIHKNLNISEEPIKLSPLQKIAIILSSLKPGDAEKMYHLILSGISSKDLDGLSTNISRRQLLSLLEIRRWVVDDFLWFLKGSYWPGVLYSPSHWSAQLQQLANKSPQKCAAALRELWLNPGVLQQRFDKFVGTDNNYAAYWIRRYVTSAGAGDSQYSHLLPEKAFILTQILPGELSLGIRERLGPAWKRIFRLVPRKLYQVDPAEAGEVITQYLSYYYSTFGKSRFEKPGVN